MTAWADALSPGAVKKMSYRFIGQPMVRTEDARLIQGLGRYTADLAPSGHCRLYVVRSPYPAALIKSIDAEAARAAPGVRLVLTPDDPELERLGTFTSRVRRKAPNGEPNFEPPYRVLTKNKAQFVGDAIVAIIADTLDQ